uniref:Uncharacterized protein n=1 Tax=Nelumbo nucifera TaxID=4432 RepID=A0A822YM56_NELNU|nr:TPA_asm: hypothetical protein HUJ06_009269 [Nelumbo nucifera]
MAEGTGLATPSDGKLCILHSLERRNPR